MGGRVSIIFSVFVVTFKKKVKQTLKGAMMTNGSDVTRKEDSDNVMGSVAPQKELLSRLNSSIDPSCLVTLRLQNRNETAQCF